MATGLPVTGASMSRMVFSWRRMAAPSLTILSATASSTRPSLVRWAFRRSTRGLPSQSNTSFMVRRWLKGKGTAEDRAHTGTLWHPSAKKHTETVAPRNPRHTNAPLLTGLSLHFNSSVQTCILIIPESCMKHLNNLFSLHGLLKRVAIKMHQSHQTACEAVNSNHRSFLQQWQQKDLFYFKSGADLWVLRLRALGIVGRC